MLEIKNYATEATVDEDSALVGKTVGDVHKAAGGGAMVTGIIGPAGKRRVPFPDAVLKAGDKLMLEGEHIRPGTTAPAPIITTLPSTNPAPSTGGTNSTPAPATPGGPVTQPTPQERTVPTSQSHEPPPRTDQP